MPHNHYSDEPRLIKPAVTDRRFIAFLVVILLGLIALTAVIGIPMYRSWQEEQAHNVERGNYQGAVYNVDINGKPQRIELGWNPSGLIVVMPMAPTEFADTLIHVKGSFGSETLRPNLQYPSLGIFGPGKTQLDPFRHHRLSLSIERNGQTIWSGKLWAWGIHDHSHGHSH